MDITTNINLPNYSIEYTPTESHVGRMLLYISNNIAYKPKNDLTIYKSHDELESTFIEIINTKKSLNLLRPIVRCPYTTPRIIFDFLILIISVNVDSNSS